MTIFDLFSKRQKRLRGEVPDVYEYDKIPNPLRVQIVHIWDDSLGSEQDASNHDEVYKTYKLIVETLRREYGVFRIYGNNYQDMSYRQELVGFFGRTKCGQGS